MGSYLAKENLNRYLPAQKIVDLTSDAQAEGGGYAADWDVVDTEIDAAEARLNGYLVKRVPVPVASPTAELIKDVATLVSLALHRRRGLETENMIVEEKRMLEKYAAIADGRIELVGVTDVVGPTDATVAVGKKPFFSDDDDGFGWM